MNKNTIRVVVDENHEFASKNAISPLEKVVGKSLSKVVEFEVNELTNELSSCVEKVQGMLANLPRHADDLALEEVSFTVGIDASGKASIFSVISGSSVVRTGITFQMKYTNLNANSKKDE